MPVCESVCMPVCESVCMPVCESVCLYVSQSVCLYASQSVCGFCSRPNARWQYSHNERHLPIPIIIIWNRAGQFVV